MILGLLCLLVPLAATVNTGDTDLVEEIWASYQQNRRAFATVRVACEWVVEVTPIRRQSADLEAKAVEQKLASLKTPLTEKDRLLIEDHIKKLRQISSGTNKDFAPAQYQFTVGPGGLEVRTEVPSFDTRLQDAKRRSIPSFTGDDIRLCRHALDGKWRCLEPYPNVSRTNPIGFGQSELTVHGMLPPMVPHRNLHAEIDPLDLFWGPRDRIRSLGRIETAGAVPCDVLARLGDDSPGEIWLVAYEPDGHGFARWAARWLMTPPGEGKTLAQEVVASKRPDLVKAMFDQIESLSSAWSAPRLKNAFPIGATYWQSVQEVPDAGWYPRLVRRSAFGPVRLTGIEPNTDPDDLPVGRHEDGTLTVRSIEANFALPTDAFTIEYTKGTDYFDLDSNTGGVIGVTLDDRLRSVVPLGQPSGNGVRMIVIANILVLLVIVTVAVVRARLRKLPPPSPEATP